MCQAQLVNTLRPKSNKDPYCQKHGCSIFLNTEKQSSFQSDLQAATGVEISLPSQHCAKLPLTT